MFAVGNFLNFLVVCQPKSHNAQAGLKQLIFVSMRIESAKVQALNEN